MRINPFRFRKAVGEGDEVRGKGTSEGECAADTAPGMPEVFEYSVKVALASVKAAHLPTANFTARKNRKPQTLNSDTIHCIV